MHIALIAMSGVRAASEELNRVGMTMPGFVERSKVIASLPSLGLLYLAACTPEGHSIRYFEAESDRTEPAEIYTCDLVAISTFSSVDLGTPSPPETDVGALMSPKSGACGLTLTNALSWRP